MSWKFNKIERFYPTVCNRYELLCIFHMCPFISKYYVCFLILQFCLFFFFYMYKRKRTLITYIEWPLMLFMLSCQMPSEQELSGLEISDLPEALETLHSGLQLSGQEPSGLETSCQQWPFFFFFLETAAAAPAVPLAVDAFLRETLRRAAFAAF